jgi:proline iminopeptidase
MNQALDRDPLTWLYPQVEPYKTHMLKVSGLHEIYVEESGNPSGKPVVFVHGGPGGGTEAKYRRFFDPRQYRIILFDQRGCGKSLPYAELRENTTWDLVADMERIRQHLGIERWQVFGGSWGSTLALCYAETHPERVTELVLRGIFLMRQRDISWFYQFGASESFPDEWEAFEQHIPAAERHDYVTAYYKRLTSEDKAVQIAAAKVWSVWEGATSKLIPDAKVVDRFADDHFAVPFARIESHYFFNKGFLRSENQILEDIGKIRHIPAVIVQGRYDTCCPVRNAWDLHRAWPEAELFIVPDAGHSASEPGISRALVSATDKFAFRCP